MMIVLSNTSHGFNCLAFHAHSNADINPTKHRLVDLDVQSRNARDNVDCIDIEAILPPTIAREMQPMRLRPTMIIDIEAIYNIG